MSRFQFATVLFYVTSVLTSTVIRNSDHDQGPPSELEKLFESTPNDTKHPTLLRDIRSSNSNAPASLSRSGNVTPIFTEGGIVRHFPDRETKSSTEAAVIHENVPIADKKLMPTLQETIAESDKNGIESEIVARKRVGKEKKTMGRKDVEFEDFSQKDKTVTPDNVVKPLVDVPVVKAESISPMIEKTDVKISLNETQLDKTTDIVGNKNSAPTVILVSAHPNNTASHKRKPTSTTSEDDDDDGKGMPSSPTKPEIGMPRKVDYIIPVVITIMATPVLGIAAFVLYTRGRDCWDKRHYRRMDFLIDGMYND